MPSHNLDDIDERDLSEAPRLAKEPESRGVMIALAAAAALFVALLVYGSFPDLSPEEIVSMDGYEGEQQTKTIFNIHSFDNDDEALATTEQVDDNLPPIAVTEPVVTTQPDDTAIVPETVVTKPLAQTDPAPQAEPVESQTKSAQSVAVETTPQAQDVPVQDELPIAVTEPVPAEQSDVTPVAVAEPNPEPVTAPVVVSEPVVEPVTVSSVTADTSPSRVITFSSARDEKVVAAMATTPTIEEASDTVVVASVAAVEPVPAPVGRSLQQFSANDDQDNTFLPLRSVLQDATELKATPTPRSRTLLTLRRGVTVTVFESDGEWTHIGTNDGSSITGYVPENSLGPAEQ